MKKEKVISCLILIGIVLALPSVAYLVGNTGNIAKYSGEYFYMIGQTEKAFTNSGALIFAWSVILMFFLYAKLIKKSEEFKSIKSVLLAAGIVGITFVLSLPNTSKDVFFYMGNGRLIDKYGFNPYSTSVSEMENLDTSDCILKTVGSQNEYKFVYGPLFLTICGLLNKISFSSVALYLYEFKILNLLVYLLTTYLIYKLTKRKKLAIVFAFNPLVLLEVLVNVHNDIFVVFFALLGFLFVKESEKCRKKFGRSEFIFFLGLICFAFSAAIKYITILILPFVILYRLRNENWLQKIVLGITYLLVFIGIFGVMYLPYYKNPIGIFDGIILQSGKLKDSIYLMIAMITEKDSKIVSICYSIGFFVLLYLIVTRILMQAFRKNNFGAMMENIYLVLLGLIFLGMTNLTSWYLLWLIIPVFWTNGRRIKNWIWIGILYELTYTIFYVMHSDNAIYQAWILPCVGLGMIVRQIFLNLK